MLNRVVGVVGRQYICTIYMRLNIYIYIYMYEIEIKMGNTILQEPKRFDFYSVNGAFLNWALN